MNETTNPWENDYRRRGRLWGGNARDLPWLPASSRILELGCGDGKTVSLLVQKGYQVTAFDISDRAVTLCRDTSTDPDLLRILIADARKIPFRDEIFDLIIASHITGHLSRDGRRRLAGEVERLLAPAGRLFFCDFSCGDFRYGRGRETETGTFARNNGIATHYFTDREVLALFPGLVKQFLRDYRWNMRVKGTLLPRAEIMAEFIKPA